MLAHTICQKNSTLHACPMDLITSLRPYSLIGFDNKLLNNLIQIQILISTLGFLILKFSAGNGDKKEKEKTTFFQV
jgi:hypothetical protein